MELANLVLTSILALLTLVLTYRTVVLSSKSVSGETRPVLAVAVTKLFMGPKFLDGKRQDFSVHVKIKNIGNAAAISVSADCEIRLAHTIVDGGATIPQRFPADILPYLPVNDGSEIDFSFGNRACELLREDCRDQDRQNQKRIALNPAQEAIGGPTVIVTVYYRNVHGDALVTRYTSSFDPIRTGSDGMGNREFHGWGMPDSDENIEFSLIRYKELTFTSEAISADRMKAEMEARDGRRNLSGW